MESKPVANPFFHPIKKGGEGRGSLAAWCLSGNSMIDRGAFTVVSDGHQRTNRPSSDRCSPSFPHGTGFLQGTRLLGAPFEVSEKEARPLEAVRDGVTTRSVEMRLQSLRRKHKVRNSSDVVYKAVAHGYLAALWRVSHNWIQQKRA